ncbi:MAG: leucine-rich repeat protein [Bacteroidales bacterium]|nr:leucine-rich repeat protein [Bacteroidales bacterium]
MKLNERTETSGYIDDIEPDYVLSDRFEIECELPSEGYNRLFKAVRYGKYFVLKGLKEKYRDNNLYRGLIIKEFDILVSLNHPNIVRCYGIEEVEDLGLCIIMEYVDGVTLDKFLETKPSSAQRRKVVKQMLNAMDYYHELQLVHRDLKPSNILITNNAHNVRIIDFGLADTDYYAVFKEPAFTRQYASPEQLNGEKLDCRSDIYSFGKVLAKIFPNRYKRIAKKCNKEKRKERYPNADYVYQAMFSVKKKLYRAAIVVIVLGLLSYLTYNYIHYYSKPFETQIASGQTLKMQIIDSKAVVLANNNVKGDLHIPEFVSYRLRKFPVTRIEDRAFFHNNEITRLTLPENLEHLGAWAFSSCPALSDTLVLPKNLKEIGNDAFCGTNISCLVIKSEKLEPIDSTLENNFFFNCANLQTIICEQSVKNLTFSLLRSAHNLKEVVFPESLNEIPEAFFAHAKISGRVSFPKDLKTVGWSAFFDAKIDSVILPKSVKEIRSYAFNYSNIKKIDIGSEIEVLGEKSLADLLELDTLIIRAKTPPLAGQNFFLNSGSEKFVFLVPKESLDAYKTHKEFSKLKPKSLN